MLRSPSAPVRVRRLVTTLLALTAIVVAGPASASSDSAWRAFRVDVAKRCRTAAASQLTGIRLQVDPFGSADYGLALVSGVEHGADRRVRVICVYDKHTHRVALGTPLPDRAD